MTGSTAPILGLSKLPAPLPAPFKVKFVCPKTRTAVLGGLIYVVPTLTVILLPFDVPTGVVTTTLPLPINPAPTTAVIDVGELTQYRYTPTPPIVTEEVREKFVPVIVIVFPGCTVVELIFVIVGGDCAITFAERFTTLVAVVLVNAIVSVATDVPIPVFGVKVIVTFVVKIVCEAFVLKPDELRLKLELFVPQSV